MFIYATSLVERVVYPGLPSYPAFELAASQTDGPGAMVI